MTNTNFYQYLLKAKNQECYEVFSDLPVINFSKKIYIKKNNIQLPMWDDFIELSSSEYLQSYESKKIINFFTKKEHLDILHLQDIVNIICLYNDNIQPKKYLHKQMVFLAKYLLFLYANGFILFPNSKDFYYKDIPINKKKTYLLSLENNYLNDLNNYLKKTEVDSNTVTSIYKVLLCIDLFSIEKLDNQSIHSICSSLVTGNQRTSVEKVFKKFCILSGNKNISLARPSVDLSINLCKKEVFIPVMYVENLPILNTNLEFLISQSLNTKEAMLKEWNIFSKVFKDIEKKSIDEYLSKNTMLNIEDFDDIKHLIQYFAYLVEVGNTEGNSLGRQMNLIYRFIIYLVAHTKVLFPIVSKYFLTKTTAKYRLAYYQSNKKELLYKKIDELEKFDGTIEYSKNSLETQINYLLRMFSSLNSKEYRSLIIEDLYKYRDNLIKMKYYKRNDSASNIVHSLQRYLKNHLQLKHLPYPSEIRISRIADALNQNRRDEDFKWIDSTINNQKQMQEIAKWYIGFRKKVERRTVGTIKGDINSINKYFDWLFYKYPEENYDANFIYDTFDYYDNEEHSYPFYLNQTYSSSSTKEKLLNIPIRMFRIASQKKFQDLLGCVDETSGMAISKDNIKSPRKKMNTIVYLKTLEVLIERPPKYMNSRWKINTQKIDMKWWQHEVYPALPISLILMLLGAQRSANILNLCREKSFYFENNSLVKIIINTDKITKRKSMPEILNAWDYFDNVIKPFHQWHKAFFPDLGCIKYKNDKNSVWQEFVPIMNLPYSSKPMDRDTLMSYWKRTLCHVQLELKSEGIDVLVAWDNTGDILNSHEDIDNMDNSYIKDHIEVIYDLHSIRGSALTYYNKKGLSPVELMFLSGHQNFNMIYNAYLELDENEIREKLAKIAQNYDFSSETKITQAGKQLINNEIIPSYIRSNSNYKEIVSILDSKELFILDRTIDGVYGYKHGKGFVNTHPATWASLLFGICPGASCPNGNMRCSLCPYLITGPLFLKGIVIEINRLFIQLNKVQNDLKYYREHNDDIPAKRLTEEYESVLLEIIGWVDVVDNITNRFYKDFHHNSSTDIVPIHKSIIGVNTVQKDIGILEYFSKVSKMNNTPIDTYIRDHVTKLALKYIVKHSNSDEIKMYLEDDDRMIDFLLQSYKDINNIPNLLDDFIVKLKS